MSKPKKNSAASRPAARRGKADTRKRKGQPPGSPKQTTASDENISCEFTQEEMREMQEMQEMLIPYRPIG